MLFHSPTSNTFPEGFVLRVTKGVKALPGIQHLLVEEVRVSEHWQSTVGHAAAVWLCKPFCGYWCSTKRSAERFPQHAGFKWTRGEGLALHQGRSGWVSGEKNRNPSPKEWSGCSGQWKNPHFWRCSRGMKMQHLGAWFRVHRDDGLTVGFLFL